MAFTFDSTVKGTSANSYVSVEDADDYFGGHPRSTDWESLTTLERQQYLVKATSRLDYERYGGEIAGLDQSLQWPRLWIVDRNQEQSDDYVEFVNGDYYRDSNSQPRELKIATYEMALWYLDEIKLANPTFSRNDQERMEMITIGPLSAKLRRIRESALPDEVKRALSAIGPNGWTGDRQMKLVR